MSTGQDYTSDGPFESAIAYAVIPCWSLLAADLVNNILVTFRMPMVRFAPLHSIMVSQITNVPSRH